MRGLYAVKIQALDRPEYSRKYATAFGLWLLIINLKKRKVEATLSVLFEKSGHFDNDIHMDINTMHDSF